MIEAKHSGAVDEGRRKDVGFSVRLGYCGIMVVCDWNWCKVDGTYTGQKVTTDVPPWCSMGVKGMWPDLNGLNIYFRQWFSVEGCYERSLIFVHESGPVRKLI